MHKFISSIVLFLFAVTFQQSEIYSKAELIGKAPMNHYENEYKVRKEVYDAFNLMQSEALKDGIDIEIVSSYRSFKHQKRIWTRKYSKYISQGLLPLEAIDKIIEYSTIPGTSRHHWGTDIDVYAPNLLSNDDTLQLEAWEYSDVGPFAVLTKWLKQNSERFGFYFPYDCYRGGIAHEPWHLSYAPLADKFQRQFSVELLENAIKNSSIEGKSAILNHLNEIYQNFIININLR